MRLSPESITHLAQVEADYYPKMAGNGTVVQ
jgi:hypothetical protein